MWYFQRVSSGFNYFLMSGELECQVTVQSLDEATTLFMIYRKLTYAGTPPLTRFSAYMVVFPVFKNSVSRGPPILNS